MKVKRFKNLWTMGLILFSAMMFILLVVKMIFPEFVVGVAESAPIVAFGNYVDTHMWAYYLFNGLVSFATCYIYCCACCRKTKLNWKQSLISLGAVIIIFVIQALLPQASAYINYVALILLPCIFSIMDKQTDIKYFISTTVCFVVHILGQYWSLSIRDISTMISYPNSGTFTILTIDMFIWLFLLYSYFNFKNSKKEI